MEAGSGAAAAVGGAALGLLGAACSHDILDRSLRTGCHLEDDDIVTELVHIHPRERPDWEETISAMARSAEIPELRAEPLMRSSSSSTASMKVKNVKKLSFTKGHFPKLAECAHFHYENVDFGSIQKLLFALAAAASCSHVSVAVRFGGEWREQLFLWLKTFRGLHMWKGGAPFLLSPLSLLLFGGSLPPSFFVWDAPTRERRRREGEGIQPDRQRSRAGGHQENKP
ncbi:Rho GTPase-activating protein 32 [Oryzias melastigma]|uniref:Rho GTPase-activating protein 32 n=1 Tax=Oryzias melastigma TaxID=30732 RepID=A0A834L1U6_ORYME|nr:Rho GTPase-activating protein 32 [Oryzias melastigma]